MTRRIAIFDGFFPPVGKWMDWIKVFVWTITDDSEHRGHPLPHLEIPSDIVEISWENFCRSDEAVSSTQPWQCYKCMDACAQRFDLAGDNERVFHSGGGQMDGNECGFLACMNVWSKLYPGYKADTLASPNATHISNARRHVIDEYQSMIAQLEDDLDVLFVERNPSSLRRRNRPKVVDLRDEN
jgi:hypothetical protein